MLISKAWAEDVANKAGAAATAAVPPDASETFILNIGLLVIIVGLFYLLMIRPQQRRIREHATMLSALKKGEKVVTQGGVVAKVDKVLNDHEVSLDIGNGQKVTVLRSAISYKYDEYMAMYGSRKGANENKADEGDSSSRGSE